VARVLVTRPLPEGGLDPLLDAGHEMTGLEEAGGELASLAPGFDAILCLLTDPIDAHVLRAGAAGRLRVVSVAAVGY
jgi:hypothetical protein